MAIVTIVNTAGRAQPVARAGQILVTRTVREQKGLKSAGVTSKEQQHDLAHPQGTFHQDRLESFAIIDNTMPPRDPDEEDEEDEEDDSTDEPPVVREPDED